MRVFNTSVIFIIISISKYFGSASYAKYFVILHPKCYCPEENIKMEMKNHQMPNKYFEKKDGSCNDLHGLQACCVPSYSHKQQYVEITHTCGEEKIIRMYLDDQCEFINDTDNIYSYHCYES
uniref:SUEL-type lectin domain-containing protein n=1 Tax=Strongyloides papillosus TaxID=174720 RepID=A0A0N5C1S7_STREA